MSVEPGEEGAAEGTVTARDKSHTFYQRDVPDG